MPETRNTIWSTNSVHFPGEDGNLRPAGDLRNPLWLLRDSPPWVLLIASANLANLMLAAGQRTRARNRHAHGGGSHERPAESVNCGGESLLGMQAQSWGLPRPRIDTSAGGLDQFTNEPLFWNLQWIGGCWGSLRASR